MLLGIREIESFTPNKTVKSTGSSSEKLPVVNSHYLHPTAALWNVPAGRRYKMDFRRFSKQRRPYWMPVTMAEKSQSSIKSAASCEHDLTH
jgi:hypothetical protein